jgi:hypothetical protein
MARGKHLHVGLLRLWAEMSAPVRAVQAGQAMLRGAGRDDEAARAQAHVRFPSCGCRGRLADSPRARRLANASKVQRYVHLSPGHLAAAVEKIVATPAVVAPRAGNSSELRQNFESAEAGSRTMRSETRTQTSEILGAEGWPSPVEGVRLEIG